jgi:hypothetical protein
VLVQDTLEASIVVAPPRGSSGSVFRAVPVPRTLIPLLTAYGMGKPDRLWPWGRTTAWKIVKAVMREAGIAECLCKPKALRHAFAVEAGQKYRSTSYSAGLATSSQAPDANWPDPKGRGRCHRGERVDVLSGNFAIARIRPVLQRQHPGRQAQGEAPGARSHDCRRGESCGRGRGYLSPLGKRGVEASPLSSCAANLS